MGAVQDAVEDSVGQRGFADVFVPVFDRQLAGDDRGSGVGAVVYHFQQIVPFALHQRRQAPVVKDEQIGLGERCQPLAEAPIGMRHLEFIEQSGNPDIKHGQPLPARLIAQRASNPGLAAAGGAGQDQVLLEANPVAAGKVRHLPLIQSATGSVIDVLDAGFLFELGCLQQPGQPPILPMEGFPVDDEPDALFEGQALDGGVRPLL